jgi:hypothetical protein
MRLKIKPLRRREPGAAKEILLNCDDLPQDAKLSDEDEARWSNRKQLRGILEVILEKCELPDGLEQLNVVGFAAALEAAEWYNEVDLDGYTEKMQGLRNEVADWREYWDDGDGHVHQKTGCQLIMACLKKEFDGKFNTVVAPPDDTEEDEDLDNELAELGGWQDPDPPYELRNLVNWTKADFIGMMPHDLNPDIRLELHSDIKALLNRFPADEDVFDFVIFHAIWGIMYQAFTVDYKPHKSMEAYVVSLFAFSSLV